MDIILQKPWSGSMYDFLETMEVVAAASDTWEYIQEGSMK